MDTARGWNIAILAAAAIVGSVVLAVALQSSATRSKIPLASPTAVAVDTSVTTYGVPQTSSVKVGQQGKIDIVVDASKAEKKVSAVQLHFSFNPKFIKITKIEAGSAFSEATILQNEVDSKKGDAAFVIGSPEASQTKGVVAQVFVQGVGKGTSLLSFTSDTKIVVLGKTKPLVPKTVSATFNVIK